MFFLLWYYFLLSTLKAYTSFWNFSIPLLKMTASCVESVELPSLHPQFATSFLSPEIRISILSSLQKVWSILILFFCLWLLTSFWNGPMSEAVRCTIENPGTEEMIAWDPHKSLPYLGAGYFITWTDLS